MNHKAKTLSVLTALVLMSGCGADLDELQGWVAQQRQASRPTVKPLEAPKKFVPEAYRALDAIEPFSTQKLSSAARQEASSPNSVLAAEMSRRREPLEAFPLDAIHMVGSLVRGGKHMALVKADNLLYQVKVGEHMGQNFGKVTRVSETELTLREIVQDAAGEWIERNTTLQLQESGR